MIEDKLEAPQQNTGGRPLKAGAKRDKRFPLRMSEADRDFLQQAADVLDKSLGAFIRDAVSNALENNEALPAEILTPSSEVTLGVLMKENEKELFARAAVRAGVSMNALLRGLALVEATRIKKENAGDMRAEEYRLTAQA